MLACQERVVLVQLRMFFIRPVLTPTVHALLAANCVQVDCVLVHVVGSIQAESSTAFSSSSSSQSAAAAAAAVKFTESFILARSSSGNYYIANQAFQLIQ
jgi:hypothetical protein